LKFQYSGGVLPEEKPTIEMFERDVLPFINKNGGYIGESAMQGNADAEEVIKRYNMFCNGMPHLREANLKGCIAALKRWESKRVN
jgi:hypothetical protein